ncbi:iron complex transport system permease [Enterococcus sp. DIV2402]|uniref:Iron complex transport system permease n=1 Tax=Candidatus Enterococcus lowellii TaxID=2230877 RepID=A0ABZ2SPZ9_9ENTE|nr:iron ABC transporter permease [Enterococcus sp. DIV2402]MBO0465870.1 iron ABC transporter permease [Enterococcus sp. DIV2402]
MKKRYIFPILLLLIVLLVLFALTHGKLALTWSEIWEIMRGGGTSAKRLLLVDFRLPRIVLAILAGAALAVGGAVLQSTTQNPLADSGILGINAGAGLFVLLFISFVQSTTVTTFLLPLIALVGALLTAVIIFAFAYKKRIGIMPVRLILTGVVVGTGISALTLLLVTKLDSENYRFVTMWQAGSIWGSNWFFVCALLPWLLILVPWFFFKHRELDILQFGDATAISLGVNIQKERIKLIVAAVALTGAAVSVTGGIGFLGLIAPHIAKRLGFKKHWQLLPIAAIIGSLLLLLSDTIGRLSPGSGEIPAGTVVAIIGAPYFLFLLLKEST